MNAVTDRVHSFDSVVNATHGQASIPLVETSGCMVCGAPQYRQILQGPDRLHHISGSFTLVQCFNCGLVYQSPRVADSAIDQLYPQTYEPFQAGVAEEGYIARDLRQTAAFVSALRPEPGRLLDVGCGSGDFLMAMQRLYPGWELIGLEPNAGAVQVARQRGLDVQQGTLQTWPRAGQFDVVTLWNVVEHVSNPLDFLCEIRNYLAPNAWLCLAVPMHDSWEAQLFGRYWVGWEQPRHLYVFNRSTIHRLLAKAGFRVRRQAGVSGTYYGMVQSSKLVLESLTNSYTLRRLGEATLHSRPLRLVLKPYTFLAERMQRGTVLTLAAQLIDKDC